MSLLIFQHYPTHVAVFTDTLATTPKGEPLAFFNKCMVYPQFHMIMAVTGIFQLADRWNSTLNGGMIAEDIDMIDAHTPKILRDIWADLIKINGGSMPSTSTVYHFGYSKQKKQYVRYVYRSENNFTSELYTDAGIGIKPQPDDKSSAPETVDDVIALANKIRSEQNKKPKSEKIYIGGEVFLTLISDQGIAITKVHRFDDYDTDWQSVNNGIREQSLL